MKLYLNAKDISLGGILTALTLILLYLTLILSLNKLSLLTFASFIIIIAYVQRNIKTALLVYISSSILAFFIVPFNIALLYITPFGLYNLIRYFIDQVKKLPLQLVYKFIVFNILLVLSLGVFKVFIGLTSWQNFYFTLSQFLSRFINIKRNHPNLFIPWLFCLGFFIAYDYALILLLRSYKMYFSKQKR